MMIHKLQLKDLTLLYLQQLQEQYLHGDMEVEIRIHPKASKVEYETQFWRIIAQLDWEKMGDDEAVIAPAVASLSTSSIEEIYRFQDILSEKLFLLDGKKYAKEIRKDAYGTEEHFSADIFLYARCCMVASGKIAYEATLNNPKEMIKDLTFEPLLYLANKAYELKTGEEWDYVAAFNYETYFNADGWDRKKPLIF